MTVFAQFDSITEVINKKRPSANSEIFNNELYQGSMKEENLTDKTLVKLYYLPVWTYAGLSPNDIEAKLNDIGAMMSYIVLDEEPYIAVVNTSKDSKITVDKKEYGKSKTYVDDILASAVYDTPIAAKDIGFTDVICFDYERGILGTVVYYLNGDNTIVMCYSDHSSEGVAYTLADFQKYGTAYYNYISSDEYMYDEEGNRLYGQNISFNTYVTDVYNPSHDVSIDEQPEAVLEESSVPEVSAPEESSVPESNNDAENKDNRLWWLFGGVIFSIVIIIAVVYIAKKK